MGVGWQAPVGISGGAQGTFEPQAVTTAQGETLVVWNSFNGAYDTIELATRLTTGVWQAPGFLSAPGQIGAPQIAVDPQGVAIAIWSRVDEHLDAIVQATTRPAGGAWQAPIGLSAPGEGAAKPQLATDPQGNAVAVWERIEGAHSVAQATTRSAGGSWQSPVTLTGALASGEGAFDAQVAVDAQGNAVAVWWRSSLTLYVIQAATRPAGGSWQPSVTLSAGDQHAVLPQVAADPQGNVTVAWGSILGASNSVWAATRPAGGLWQPPVPISSPGQVVAGVQVVADAQGNTVAVWTWNGVVQAATKPTGGFSWQVPVILSAAGQNASKPQLAVGPQGDMVAVWERGGVVQASTKSAGGTWQAPVDVSAPGSNASNPQTTVGPQGDAVAVWESGSVVQAAVYEAP